MQNLYPPVSLTGRDSDCNLSFLNSTLLRFIGNYITFITFIYLERYFYVIFKSYMSLHQGDEIQCVTIKRQKLKQVASD